MYENSHIKPQLLFCHACSINLTCSSSEVVQHIRPAFCPELSASPVPKLLERRGLLLRKPKSNSRKMGSCSGIHRPSCSEKAHSLPSLFLGSEGFRAWLLLGSGPSFLLLEVLGSGDSTAREPWHLCTIEDFCSGDAQA